MGCTARKSSAEALLVLVVSPTHRNSTALIGFQVNSLYLVNRAFHVPQECTPANGDLPLVSGATLEITVAR